MDREAMKQPEALRLADALDDESTQGRISNYNGRKAAVELRRLHERCEQWRDIHDAVVADSDKVYALLRQALEALDSDNPDIQLRAATYLRQALVDADDISEKRVDEKAKREQEPVAYWNTDESSLSFKPGRSGVWVPLYSDPKPCPTCESSNERSDIPMWERAYEQVCEERDAIVKDSDKAYELLRWAETEMRYAKWGTRLNDQHGRTDVYTAIVEFLK